MGLLFWKDNKAIDAFAHALADDLFSYVQPDIAKEHLFGESKEKKKKQRKIEQKLTDVVLQVKRFNESKSLGIYGKARLQQTFNARLEELGYDSTVVNKITEIVLTRAS